MLLLSKLSEYASAATDATDGADDVHSNSCKRREFCRGLSLFAHRNYLQSLQLVASADIQSYRNLYEDCGGDKGFEDIFALGILPGKPSASIGVDPGGKAGAACARMVGLWWPPDMETVPATAAFPLPSLHRSVGGFLSVCLLTVCLR